jgi:hypothetical protein
MLHKHDNARWRRWWPALSLVLVLGLLASAGAQEEKKDRGFGKKGPPDFKGFMAKKAEDKGTSDRLKQLEDEVSKLREQVSALTSKQADPDKAERKGPPPRFGDKGERKGPPPRFGDKGERKGPPWRFDRPGERKGPPPAFARDRDRRPDSTDELNRRFDQLQRDMDELRRAIQQRRP